jgi:hypothetical protein
MEKFEVIWQEEDGIWRFETISKKDLVAVLSNEAIRIAKIEMVG